MIICGQCGTSSEGAKFCPECGLALAVAERPVTEERKVVTALFCGLVGFTSLSDAAGRWEQFGAVPEQAFALLGCGRCLVGLDRLSEATPALQQARGLFHTLGAAPGIAETDALLETATALSS